MTGRTAFLVALGGIAVLGGVAYYLESKKRELHHAIDVLDKKGWLNPEWVTTHSSSRTVSNPSAAQQLRDQPRKV
jgi:hypothetical protein